MTSSFAIRRSRSIGTGAKVSAVFAHLRMVGGSVGQRERR